MNARAILLLSAFTAACSAPPASEPASTQATEAPAATAPSTAVAVRDSVVRSTQDAVGVAAPMQSATISTRLMGSVMEVMVREGDRVAAGQALARIDARDVDAKRLQVGAAVAAAEASQAGAQLQLKRMRALVADTAAPRALLDAAETGAAQADAGVRAAKAAAAEVAALGDYAVIRASFAGVVTKRFVDAGAFAAPGAPLVQVQDLSRLRITVSAPPEAARGARRGAMLDAEIDGHSATAVVEGVVPSPAGGVYTINAIVANPDGALSAGAAAVLHIPSGTRHALLVPAAAVTNNGDLTGVRVGPTGDLRWVKVGPRVGLFVEILSGLRVGELVLVPTGAAK